jgi:hypothetical protein
LLFCTPVGLTWYERAQTDLYMASAFLFLAKGIRDDSTVDFVWAGLLASLKWSSFPFFGIVGLTYILLKRDHKLHRASLVFIAACMPVLLLVVFGRHALDYIMLVSRFEEDQSAEGISLSRFLPRIIAHILPLALPLLFLMRMSFWRKGTREFVSTMEVLFWGVAGLMSAGFGTRAYEYRLVSMLFLVPLVVDKRSVLSSEAHPELAPWSRLVGIAVLIYAFRVQTHFYWLDQAIGLHRSFMPIIGLFLLLGLSLLSEYGAKRAWGRSSV